ncbi:MAG: diguanylate cyclase [Candidatus Omnitrophica bacterium]|nr:diguanylate cyclase [Candidatus Omnitrophota bacterium]
MDQEKLTQPGLKVLLVEDDPEFANILQVRLGHEKNPPLEITCLPTLQQAQEALAEKDWDLILLDLMLPDSSGIQTFTAIRSQARHTPVVIMSGLDSDDLAIDAVRKGAEDYLVKGELSSRLLLRVIHHAVDRHHIKEKLASVTGRLRESNRRLETMSLLDPLTELYNRRGLQQALRRELQIVSREGGKLMVLFLDIDDFKKINDSLGHPVGDILLKEISKKIKDSVRVSDHVARIGGDEFILLLPKTPFKEGLHLAERLRSAMSFSASRWKTTSSPWWTIIASAPVFPREPVFRPRCTGTSTFSPPRSLTWTWKRLSKSWRKIARPKATVLRSASNNSSGTLLT